MSRFLLLALLVLPLRAQTVAEQYLLTAVNQERAAHRLAPVHLDPALTHAAARHAEEMARRRTISHQFSGEPDLAERGSATGARFDRITENVAEGPSILGVHDALMRSSGHRANILDPAVDAIGIAVVVCHGQLYAAEDFARTVAPLSLDQQEASVAWLLDQAGLELFPGADARQTCVLSTGYSGNALPAFVMRYTTADLSHLPAALIQRLRSGHEHRAAVGACAPEASPFSQYRLAVLLFR